MFAIFVMFLCRGEGTGAFEDLVPLWESRINESGVKSIIGWFFGRTLYLLLNEIGEMVNFMIMMGNAGNKKLLCDKSFIETIAEKLCALHLAETH